LGPVRLLRTSLLTTAASFARTAAATAQIRSLVADDQAAVRVGFAALIAAEEEMELAGEAGNGREAVYIARRVFPHVVLWTSACPSSTGIQRPG